MRLAQLGLCGLCTHCQHTWLIYIYFYFKDVKEKPKKDIMFYHIPCKSCDVNASYIIKREIMNPYSKKTNYIQRLAIAYPKTPESASIKNEHLLTAYSNSFHQPFRICSLGYGFCW